MLHDSGHDSLVELARNPADIYSSGRFAVWRLFVEEALKLPLSGHGGNASYYFGTAIADYWDHPHCDYIRVLFDYGVIGLALLGAPMLYTLVVTCRNARTAKSPVLRDAWTTSCGGFISMCVLAVTDNVVLYVAFFSCLLFGLLGAAYGVAPSCGFCRPDPLQNGLAETKYAEPSREVCR
jgi:O-antigen ligase